VLCRRTVYWMLWGGIILYFFAWPVSHLDAYAWDNDEGLYLQRAALANAGYPLYTKTFLNKPPFLVWILQAAFRIAGTRLEVARLTCLFLNILGLAALGGVARHLWGKGAGLLCALILLGIPDMRVRAYVVTSDLPAMSFALLALASALRFQRTQTKRWLVAAGSLYGAALLIHPLLIYMAAPLATVLLWPCSVDQKSPLGRWRTLLIFSTPIAFLFLALIAWLGRPFVEAVILYNFKVKPLPVFSDVSNRTLVTTYLQARWPFLWIALTGSLAHVMKAGRHLKSLAVVGLWMVGTVAVLLQWSPIWAHYLLLLLFPLAVAAGGGVILTLSRPLWQNTPTRLRGRIMEGLRLLFLLGLLFFRWGGALPETRGWTPERQAAIAFIQETTPPGGFVISDNPLLTFVAGRLVPPPFTGASFKRILSGFLTDADAVESVLQYQSRAVLFDTGRLEHLVSFEKWVAALAQERQTFDYIRAYQMPTHITPSHDIASRVGEGIYLRGYTLSHNELRLGTVLTVTLFWEREGPTVESAHVFVHLLDTEGRLAAQHDSPPLLGAYPTDQWDEDILLPDPHPIAINPDTAPGTYSIWVGMYRWPSLERLPAFRPDGSRWLNDRIFLTKIEITAP